MRSKWVLKKLKKVYKSGRFSDVVVDEVDAVTNVFVVDVFLLGWPRCRRWLARGFFLTGGRLLIQFITGLYCSVGSKGVVLSCARLELWYNCAQKKTIVLF